MGMQQILAPIVAKLQEGLEKTPDWSLPADRGRLQG